ncbi:MAG: bifunctional cobalt-precorrin-7 (C(5))-methyltransferase CbiE/decarboxylating cobalt-precorrin-6B (C(15))-methyltransferase CbiT, partial [Desulfovibrionaceae bacterium]|nr:bifunctional cobalt-precorrin-7 (C(5))-methyltransferase CbiE/decarboxylating cobalt-precorrin-6B (C(15))-methyltransferase CbiT [Desulfovibrionaceae bacterium]
MHGQPSPALRPEQARPAGPDGSAGPRAGSLDIVSCGTGPLSADALALCLACGHVFGSAGLAARLPAPADGGPEPHPLSPSPQKALLDAVALAMRGQRCAVLASGDALYHGLGGTLARLLAEFSPEQSSPFGCTLLSLPFQVRFHPGTTAFQALFHRLGLPWDKARLFSVHAGTSPLRPMLEAELAVIYAGLPLTGGKLAQALLRVHPASAGRLCLAAEKLGTEEERLFRGTLAEAADLAFGPTSILVLLPRGAASPTLPLGLADTELAFENHCLTARRLRPVVLSCLDLPPRGVLWDLGAGAGSVGLEAALLQPGLAVHAVERKPARCANILANAERHGAAGLTLHEGGILETMEDLPKPD